MSEELDRLQAIRDGVRAVAAGPYPDAPHDQVVAGIVNVLLDAGWVSTRQRNEEMRQTAEWQRDARKAFEVVESVTELLDEERYVLTAQRLRDALGVRFSTPTPQAGS